MSNLPKAYNPKEAEDKTYQLWQESEFFNPDKLPPLRHGFKGQAGERKKKFTAAIAPPNITGELHIGHALEHTLQDIIFRMKRMQGYKTLWIPGTDHAGIATQNVIEKQLAKEGTTRHKIGREEFLKRAHAWNEKYGNTILDQFKKLGLSVDWTRTRFTLDDNYKKSVEKAFLHYYEKGWIYRGERVINWCVRCHTSISDLELNYVPEKSKLYYIKYGPFTVATVRPETKLGDTGLAVYPSDKRYKEYIGKDLEIESVDNTVPPDQSPKIKKIKIKVVADKDVDPEFGTGVIKVTPAHDFTDFNIGQKNKLPLIKVIDERGKMNENAGVRYEGMKVAQAREQIIKDLNELGLIDKEEDYEHNVARCDRCNSVIEPLPSKQWFLKMSDLASHALKASEKRKFKFHPEKWHKLFEEWLKNIKDWNISRQIWWGHKIPLEGEEDTLDTWFSSALWPFAVLGWPEKTKDFKEYYPTQFMTSGRDIIYLWIVRMVFSGVELTEKVPFENVFIHPTIMTKEGKRMSKSLGTGINPLRLIDKYGADALRFGLAYQTTGIQDMRFNEDVIMMGKKFANKLWNIARFVLMNKTGISNFQFPIFKPELEHNKQIIEKLDTTTKQITDAIEAYKFGEAAHTIYDFVWHDFADKYIEETKGLDDKETKDTLMHVLVSSLKLLHPFMPFVTEEIYSKLPLKDRQLLIVEEWPI